MTPTIEAFNGIIRRQIADQNLLVVIRDRTGRRIARLPTGEHRAGPGPSPEFLKVWKPGLEGTTQIVSPDNQARILGFSPVPEFGWTVVVGTSASQLTAPAWRAAMVTSAVGLGLLLAGGALAQLISRSVSGPIRKLARLASVADSGDNPKPIDTGLRETDEVAAILLTDARARTAALENQARAADALKRSNDALADEIAIREGAEAALLAAKQAADQANQTKSRFLTSITHELRTPLHGILGYAELLSLEGGLNPTQSGRVAIMIAAGEHLLGMINAVLDVSQIEAGRLELNPDEIALADLALACLDVVRPASEAKGLDLTLTATTPGRVFADVTRMRQVLINLLGNAIKFTASGKVDLRLTQIGDCIRLEVADTGPGIWAKHRDKLFQTFERLNANAVAGIEGTGLGLALASQLVRAMGGCIGYQDNPGGGSIFWVELPASRDSPVAPEVTVAPNCGTRPGVRVLVVDDDALNRDIAGRFLTHGGHEVVCLDNGAAAVEAANGEDFDVILMDVRMPGMNGLEATRLIRMLSGPRGAVPVIALTAQAFAEQIEICRQAGMDNHVSKPFRRAGLLATIEKIATSPRDTEPATASLAASPGDIGLPIFDGAAFEDIINTMAAADVAENLRTMIARCETLLGGLQSPDMLSRAGELAEAAHKLAGGAGTFGFLHVAAAARRFEVAADAGAPETVALGDHLAAAINASVALARREIAAMVATTERELAAD